MLGPRWRVVRTDGLLVPGFTKRFDGRDLRGTTYLWGVPIGRFRIRDASDGSTELVYLRWPVIDVLAASPLRSDDPLDAAGFIRIPRSRRLRFCRFRLTP